MAGAYELRDLTKEESDKGFRPTKITTITMSLIFSPFFVYLWYTIYQAHMRGDDGVGVAVLLAAGLTIGIYAALFISNVAVASSILSQKVCTECGKKRLPQNVEREKKDPRASACGTCFHPLKK